MCEDQERHQEKRFVKIRKGMVKKDLKNNFYIKNII